MSRFLVCWVGKERGQDPESVLCTRYLNRIKTFVKIEERVIKPFQVGEGDAIRAREGEKLHDCLAPRDILVLLDERGKSLSSPDLATLIQGHRDAGAPRIVFMIGGSMGLCPSLRQRADFVLSLGKMTLPHALARVVLLEQVYRAMCIITSHPYHHEG